MTFSLYDWIPPTEPRPNDKAPSMRILRRFPVVLMAVFILAADGRELPPTGIAYEIEVSLDPPTRKIEGTETVRWTNPSATKTVAEIPLHLYLNGFANEDTTWMRGVSARILDVDELLRLFPDPWGWIEPTVIRQNGVDLVWRPIAPDDGNPLDRSLVEVALAEPLPPGETAEIVLEFEGRLPVPMARTGGRDDFFLVAQWFPKVAAFETVGIRGASEDHWAAHQFHGPTEFYADYADYDVRIAVPPGWAVVATGKGGAEPDPPDDSRVWHRYRQRAVHDFAWATSRSMVDKVSTHQPAGSGGPVEIHIFVPQGTEHQIPRWLETTEAGLDLMGSRVGPYPYETLTVIQTPWWASPTMGMEYPTLFTGGPGDPMWDEGPFEGIRLNELVIAHEFAHQYFYGLVGTNEFEEAHLDEGFTEYWGLRIVLDLFGKENGLGTVLGRGIDAIESESAALPDLEIFPEPVLSGPSFLARNGYRFAQFYHIPALTLLTAAELFGEKTVDRVFAAYFERWAFAHPRFEDFLEVARETAGDAFADFILDAFTQDRLPDYRVVSAVTSRWKRTRGRLVHEGKVIAPDAEESEETAWAGLDPAAHESGGAVLVEILDPGWVHGDRQQPGGIERREWVPEFAEPDAEWEAEEDEFHQSTVRIAGPGWDHLPVDVTFRFADGARLRESWDGRAGYRIYRFLRGAPLSRVQIDPERRIALDPDRTNNGRTREADEKLVDDWSTWLGGLFQLALEGMSQWL